MSEFDYINRTYGLSLKRGTPCIYGERPGRVVGSLGAHINIRFDDAPTKTVGPFHPTWEMRYPASEGKTDG